VDAFVRPHGRRILETLAADATLLTGLVSVLEEDVLLEVVALLEADRADGTDERTLVRVGPLVVLER
jgi:hypothetical protein